MSLSSPDDCSVSSVPPFLSSGRERRKEPDEAWSVAHSSSSIKASDGALRAFFLLQ
ncbi:unnamed protein product, partial [Musa hybrid cultivar]